jgi:LCP family protein required for cell wall assembly
VGSASTRSVKGQILRGVGWFMLLLIVIGAGVAGGAYLYYNESIDAVAGHTQAVTRTRTLLDTLPSVNGPAVALIAGYDHRAGSGTSSYAGSNSDTLMLLRANPKNDTLSLLSFPRDLNVPIYCHGDTVSTSDRINAAWADCGANGGPLAALDTIEHLTGVPVNYLITLDFNAFVQIVHRIQGVYLNVDRRYYNKNVGTYETDYSNINLHPGYQRLNGTEALEYVRFRHLDSDLYRNGRQQLFMEALKQRLEQTLTLSNIGEVPGILRAVKGNLEIEKANGQPLAFSEMRSYLGLLLGLPGGHLLRNAIPIQDLTNINVGGADELQASPGVVAAAVHSFLHPVVPAAPAAPHAHTGTKTPKLPHKSISVLVLNAGDITGEAADTSTKLKRAGFATKTLPASTLANAPQSYDTVVYYDPSQATGEKAAEELAPLFGAHTNVEPMTNTIASLAHEAHDPLTVVAIGKSYGGTLHLPHTSKPPSHTTANAQVQDGVSMTLTAVRSKQHAAHFPLMVPHRVALGSAISTDEGVRLFKPLTGKKEFVLTFNLNGGVEYWQVEESNWTDAPLFANPTSTFKYKHRTYEEFTAGGGHIQTIALFHGGNVYWVQNTILNSLSNATMIAIAESLQTHH